MAELEWILPLWAELDIFRVVLEVRLELWAGLSLHEGGMGGTGAGPGSRAGLTAS